MFATPTFDAVRRSFSLSICVALAIVASGVSSAIHAQDNSSDIFTQDRPPDPGEAQVEEDLLPFSKDGLTRAIRAYRRGNFGRAFRLFRKLSEEGNMVADWYLGHMYQEGKGAPQDAARAFSYFGRVADAFDPNEQNETRLRIVIDAIINVGKYYRTGVEAAGIPVNVDRASYLFKLAASYGHPEAQYLLAVMAIEGRRQRPVLGLQWLLSAAKKRYAPSEAKLGDLFWAGHLVRQDRTRALMWYILAQETAHPEKDRAIILRFKTLMEQATEEERLEAAARAKVWAEQYPAPKPMNISE